MMQANEREILESLIMMLKMLQSSKRDRYIRLSKCFSFLYEKNADKTIALLEKILQEADKPVVTNSRANQGFAAQSAQDFLNSQQIVDKLLKTKDFIQKKVNDVTSQSGDNIQRKVEDANLQDAEILQQKLLLRLEETILQSNELIQKELLTKLDDVIMQNNAFVQQRLVAKLEEVITQNAELVKRNIEGNNSALNQSNEATGHKHALPKFKGGTAAQNIKDLIFSVGNDDDIVAPAEVSRAKAETKDVEFTISNTLRQTMDTVTSAYNNSEGAIYQMMRLDFDDWDAWADKSREFISVQATRQFPLKEVQGNSSFLGAKGEGDYWLVVPKKNMPLNPEHIFYQGYGEFFELSPKIEKNSNIQGVVLLEPAVFEKIYDENMDTDTLYYLVKRGKIKVEF